MKKLLASCFVFSVLSFCAVSVSFGVEAKVKQSKPAVKQTTEAQVKAQAKEQAEEAKADESEASEKYPAKTDLSQKAMKLHVGMTKQQVLNLLGNPTWGENMQGVRLVWIWQNGNCNPVFVTFDKSMKVNGYDEGRAQCLDATYTALPDSSSLCSNPKAHHLCV